MGRVWLKLRDKMFVLHRHKATILKQLFLLPKLKSQVSRNQLFQSCHKVTAQTKSVQTSRICFPMQARVIFLTRFQKHTPLQEWIVVLENWSLVLDCWHSTTFCSGVNLSQKKQMGQLLGQNISCLLWQAEIRSHTKCVDVIRVHITVFLRDSVGYFTDGSLITALVKGPCRILQGYHRIPHQNPCRLSKQLRGKYPTMQEHGQKMMYPAIPQLQLALWAMNCTSACVQLQLTFCCSAILFERQCVCLTRN